MKCCQSTRKSSDCSRPKPSLRSWECQATPKRWPKARGREKCSWGASERSWIRFYMFIWSCLLIISTIKCIISTGNHHLGKVFFDHQLVGAVQSMCEDLSCFSEWWHEDLYPMEGLRKTRATGALCWAWKDITLHDVSPKIFFQIISDSCCKDRMTFGEYSSLVPTGSVSFSSGFENPSSNRFSEAGGSFSIAGFHSCATPRKILKDVHSDPQNTLFHWKPLENTAQVFSHMTSMRQQRRSLVHQGVVHSLVRNHVLWWKWREQHPVCQSLHF